MANKHMKRLSTSLVIREMQAKTIVGYHFMPIRMVLIKKTDKKYCQGWRESESLWHCW